MTKNSLNIIFKTIHKYEFSLFEVLMEVPLEVFCGNDVGWIRYGEMSLKKLLFLLLVFF